jgi:hypothetical protein
MFVNQPIYIIIDMKDIYGNMIPTTDYSAYYNRISVSLTGGSVFI